MRNEVEKLIKAAADASNDNDGTQSMKLSQAALNCANAARVLNDPYPTK